MASPEKAEPLNALTADASPLKGALSPPKSTHAKKSLFSATPSRTSRKNLVELYHHPSYPLFGGQPEQEPNKENLEVDSALTRVPDTPKMKRFRHLCASIVRATKARRDNGDDLLSATSPKTPIRVKLVMGRAASAAKPVVKEKKRSLSLSPLKAPQVRELAPAKTPTIVTVPLPELAPPQPALPSNSAAQKSYALPHIITQAPIVTPLPSQEVAINITECWLHVASESDPQDSESPFWNENLLVPSWPCLDSDYARLGTVEEDADQSNGYSMSDSSNTMDDDYEPPALPECFFTPPMTFTLTISPVITPPNKLPTQLFDISGDFDSYDQTTSNAAVTRAMALSPGPTVHPSFEDLINLDDD